MYVLRLKLDTDSLQKRAKKTERSEKESVVEGKTIHKYKRKKRFGKSLNNRAPAMFLTILKRRVSECGGSYSTIPPGSYRASQYRHDTGIYEKIPLSQRFKIIDNRIVQRDLYSAFLLKNALNDKHSHIRRYLLFRYDSSGTVRQVLCLPYRIL